MGKRPNDLVKRRTRERKTLTKTQTPNRLPVIFSGASTHKINFKTYRNEKAPPPPDSVLPLSLNLSSVSSNSSSIILTKALYKTLIQRKPSKHITMELQHPCTLTKFKYNHKNLMKTRILIA